MQAIGFSTGSLALGDAKCALRMLAGHRLGCIELSALRVHELLPLLRSLPDLPLPQYRTISIHAPSAYLASEERQIAEGLLTRAAARGWLTVLHPDTIHDFALWAPFADRVAIENMDRRKPGRTVDELKPIFARLPHASFCFDVAHARQVDPSMREAARLLEAFGGRLAEVHLSELDAEGRHARLSRASIRACKGLGGLIPVGVPVVIEAPVGAHEIASEVLASLEAVGRSCQIQSRPGRNLRRGWRVAFPFRRTAPRARIGR